MFYVYVVYSYGNIHGVSFDWDRANVFKDKVQYHLEMSGSTYQVSIQKFKLI